MEKLIGMNAATERLHQLADDFEQNHNDVIEELGYNPFNVAIHAIRQNDLCYCSDDGKRED